MSDVQLKKEWATVCTEFSGHARFAKSWATVLTINETLPRMAKTFATVLSVYEPPPRVSKIWATTLIEPFEYSYLGEEITTLAWCYKLHLKDGTVMGFTSHDQDLFINGVLYEGKTGFVPTAAETSAQMTVDETEVQGFLSSDRITAEDINNGRFDFADILVFICDWMDLNKKHLIMRTGNVGRISYGKIGYQAEVRGISDILQNQQVRTYQKLCEAKFADEHCKINIADYTYVSMVTNTYTTGVFKTDLKQEKGYFDYGRIEFISGKNRGYIYEIKQHADGMLLLFEAPLFDVVAGDRFNITVGCDKNFSTCKGRFKNTDNFRGFPHVPGSDYATGYPQGR